MARAKHPVPFSLNKLQFNPKNGLYEISESGVIYGMGLEMTRSLKAYFGNYINQTVAEWYESLSKSDRSSVIRTGVLKASRVDNGFYPDKEWE